MLLETVIQLNHRYFIKNDIFLYFGTVLSLNSKYAYVNYAAVNLYNCKIYSGGFNAGYILLNDHTFYRYNRYKMEEILNKILKRLLGDDFFYALMIPFDNCIQWSIK